MIGRLKLVLGMRLYRSWSGEVHTAASHDPLNLGVMVFALQWLRPGEKVLITYAEACSLARPWPLQPGSLDRRTPVDNGVALGNSGVENKVLYSRSDTLVGAREETPIISTASMLWDRQTVRYALTPRIGRASGVPATELCLHVL
jgi:hypothetical protein